MTSFPILTPPSNKTMIDKVLSKYEKFRYSVSESTFNIVRASVIGVVLIVLTVVYVSIKSSSHSSWRAVPLSAHLSWYPNRDTWTPADFPPEYSHQKIIYSMSSCLSKVMNDNDVPLSIFFGNLLEMVRTGRFSTDYDHDADFVMHYSDYDKLKAIRTKIEDSCGLYVILRHMTLEYPNADEYVFRQPIARVYWSKMRPFYTERKPFYVDIWGAKKLPSAENFQYWGFDNNKYHYDPVTLQRIGLPCPMPHTDDLTPFTCPNNIITSLDNRYGKDWVDFPCGKMLKPTLAKISSKDPQLAAACSKSTTCKDSIRELACMNQAEKIESFMQTYPLGREALIRYKQLKKHTGSN